jgi:NDP-sugar pyrophosphorylase family protein
VLTNVNLRELIAFHAQHGPEPHITMALHRVMNPTECGIAQTDDSQRVTRFVEKPDQSDVFSEWANAGILIVDPEALDQIPRNQFWDVALNLVPALMDREFPVFGWRLAEGFVAIDIGQPDRYAAAHAVLSRALNRVDGELP